MRLHRLVAATAFILMALVIDRLAVADEKPFNFFPPPETPLDCTFESDFCGWQPAGTDSFQWNRRGYDVNGTKGHFSPREGYLSFKYMYTDSNLCAPEKTVCQAALVSIPMILNSTSSNTMSASIGNHTYQPTAAKNGTLDWCLEFYYFITNNQTSHQFDIDVFVDKPSDLSGDSNEHSMIVSENPEWTLSGSAMDNPLSTMAGMWRHATANIKLGSGMHQLTLLTHITKMSDSPFDQVVIAIDNTRLYKGQCVDLFEEDMLTLTYSPDDPSLAGQLLNAAVLNDINLWPHGVIPYDMSADFTTAEQETIKRSMREFEKSTCIRFRPKSSETNYLDVVKGSWCYSYAGRVINPAKQPLALHSSCINFGTVLHELNHAVGFYQWVKFCREHSRYDRDDYVTIQWDNVAPGASIQFQKYTLDQIDYLDLPYDYSSVMHYSRTAYARLPGLTTIEPKQANSAILGQRERLSDLDIRKINKKYKCPNGQNQIDRVKTTISCTFDSNFCGWSQPGDADPQWTIFDPKQAHFEAPVSSAGGSTNAMTEIGRKAAVVDLSGASDVVRLTSPVSYTSGCFSFTYFFSRNGRKALRASVVDSNSTETVTWQIVDNGDARSVPMWRRGEFAIPLSNFQIIIEADPLGSSRGVVAVNDFNFTASNSDCEIFPNNAQPTASSSQISSPAFGLNCTFERSDLCGWINVHQVDGFDWVLNNGRTQTPYTGPAFDHTLGAKNPYGIYAYAPAVNKQQGQSARIVSPALTGYSSVCLRFWYHMYGSQMGNLRVYKRQIGGQAPGDNLAWEISGNQGTGWHGAVVRITGNTDDVFQLVLEAIVGIGPRSDIAIDDITVTFNSACYAPDDNADLSSTTTSTSAPSTSTARSSTRTRTMAQTTNSPTSTQQLLSCAFSGSTTCSWDQDQGQDDMDWQVHRGASSSLNTGPVVDHTTGSMTGFYLYINSSSPRRMGDTARLRSPLITNQPLSGCFHFWFNMYGAGIGELRILTKSALDGSRHLVWRLMGERGTDWLRGQVWVNLEPVGGQILIEGIVGQSYLADVAIDDLTFTADTCETLPHSASMMAEDIDSAQPRPRTPPPIND